MGGGMAPEGLGFGVNPTEMMYGTPGGMGHGENPTTSMGQPNMLPMMIAAMMMAQGQGQQAPPAPARLPFPVQTPNLGLRPPGPVPQMYNLFNTRR